MRDGHGSHLENPSCRGTLGLNRSRLRTGRRRCSHRRSLPSPRLGVGPAASAGRLGRSEGAAARGRVPPHTALGMAGRGLGAEEEEEVETEEEEAAARRQHGGQERAAGSAAASPASPRRPRAGARRDAAQIAAPPGPAPHGERPAMELAKPAFPALPQAKEDSEVGRPGRGRGGAPPAGSPRPTDGSPAPPPGTAPRSGLSPPRAAIRAGSASACARGAPELRPAGLGGWKPASTCASPVRQLALARLGASW